MDTVQVSIWVVGTLVFVALLFDFMNGFHDAANSIATIVSTGVLKPYQAVAWAAFFNFVSIFIFHLKVAATVGKTVFRLDKGYGVQERIESRDYLILAADLQIGGTPALPKPGDQVRETEDGKTFVYEVLAPGNEPCWRYSDLYRVTLRIHTKLVATEAAP